MKKRVRLFLEDDTMASKNVILWRTVIQAIESYFLSFSFDFAIYRFPTGLITEAFKHLLQCLFASTFAFKAISSTPRTLILRFILLFYFVLCVFLLIFLSSHQRRTQSRRPMREKNKETWKLKKIQKLPKATKTLPTNALPAPSESTTRIIRTGALQAQSLDSSIITSPKPLWITQSLRKYPTTSSLQHQVLVTYLHQPQL